MRKPSGIRKRIKKSKITGKTVRFYPEPTVDTLSAAIVKQKPLNGGCLRGLNVMSDKYRLFCFGNYAGFFRP